MEARRATRLTQPAGEGSRNGVGAQGRRLGGDGAPGTWFPKGGESRNSHDLQVQVSGEDFTVNSEALRYR